MSRDSLLSAEVKDSPELLGKISHSTIIQFFSIGASLALSSFLIRSVGAENAGVITALNAVLAICLIFTTFGWPVILTKTFAGNSKLHSTQVLKRAIKECSVWVAFVSLVLYPLSWLGLLPGLEGSLIFTVALLCLRTLTALFKAALDGIGFVVAGQYCMGLIIPLITIICFLSLNPSAEIWSILLVYSLSIGLGLVLIFLLFLARFRPISSVDVTSEVEPKREGNWWLMSTRLSNVILLKADVIIMSYYLDDSSVAIYGLICQVVVILTVAISAGNSIFGPAIVKQYRAGDLTAARRTFRRVQKYIVSWSIPLFFILCICPGFIISTLAGESVAESFSFCLIALAIAQLVNAATGPVATALYMKGEVIYFSVSMMISVLLNIVGNLLLVPRYGVEGAAVATSIVAVGVNCAQYIKARTLKIA